MNSVPISRAYRFWQALTIPALVIFAILMIDMLLHPLQPEAYYNSVAYRLIGGVVFVPLTIAVGLLCMRHSPGNILGPLLIFFAVGGAAAYIRRDADATLVTVTASLGTAAYWQSILMFFLYFPDGKPHFRRVGKWVGRTVVPILLLTFFLNLVTSPTLTYGTVSSPAPVYLPAFRPIHQAAEQLFSLWGIGYLFFVLGSLIARYRAGQNRERQQLKWLVWGMSVWVTPILLNSLFTLPAWVAEAVRVYSILFSGILPPVTVGLAILRNRLWDIDVIIRRTLIYSILTASLAALYFGGVVLAQVVLKPLTASSDLSIVLSTLGIAALVNPLRHRIQTTIDRRFFRRKYNAQKTLEAFSTAIRDEVDLDTLQAALVGVVQDTMQPTKVSLWLRKTETEKLS